ncbi:arylalkylamine N-acetyltransferase-like 2 [Drosophila albomicans]|uniref:aralkylamine N-acetyltransferase n=1 Tax=Drosophila albomicans TaxID=7291 RepID=A0A6P8W3S9_DROAB|nr:arylalkylamine N-acetyltransferase-like 2 [Drosophila albomicans]
MTSITIRELRADDIDEFCRFLTVNFYGHEPVLQTPGDHKIVTDTPEKRETRLAIIRQGLSLVAVDSSNEGRIVGIAYAEEMVPNDLEINWNKVNEKKPKSFLDHVHLFLSGVEIRSKFFERFEASKALFLNILTVDATVCNQGIGRRLVAALIELGRSKGFPLIAVSCTSLYSTRVMSALGMSCVHSENYLDFKDEDGNVVLKPPAPHTSVNLMAMKL